MKLSIYTYVRNGLFLDFHVVAMLKHHLPLADEIVINEGYSDDGTYEAINGIDPKIRVYRSRWDAVAPGTSWWGCLSDEARRRCTGDWCLKLDTDEFVPEWEFDRIRKMVSAADKNLFPLRFKNFYANYKVLNARPGRSGWPEWKFAIHRNLASVHAVGDGSSVVVGSEPWDEVPGDAVELHHFGAVRFPARLRQKWRNDGAMRASKPHFDRVPSFIYDLAPHNWLDEHFLGDLEAYAGPYVDAVLKDPDEFTRDGMKVYEWLTSTKRRGIS